VMRRLYESFGGTTNAKGYIVLDSSVRVIQGDGVDAVAIEQILQALKEEGFSAENIAFGMGGALLQQPNRDTFSFAMKASAIQVDGTWRDVYKDPVSDSNKRSKRGRLALLEDFSTIREEALAGRINLLQPVYKNGKLLKETNFEAIRRRADEN